MRDIRNKSVTGNYASNDNYGMTIQSQLNSPVKGQLTEPSLDPKTQKKLFGRLSIQDVAHFTRSGGDSELGLIPGYHVNPKLRHNFANKDFRVAPSKINHFIDQLIK